MHTQIIKHINLADIGTGTATATTRSNYPIVLFHGWGVDGSIWEPIEEALSQWADVTVLQLAYEDQSLEAYCERLLGLLPKKSILLGWSLGGMLAVQMAARYPSRVAGLVTLASNGKFVATEGWPYAMSADQFDGFLAVMKQNPQRQLKRFLALIAKNDPTAKQQLGWLQNKTASIAPELINGLNLLASIDNRLVFGAIDVPALYCFGEQDALVPVLVTESVKPYLQPQQQTAVLKNTGHCLHYPSIDCLTHIERFLQTVNVRVSSASD